MTADFGNFVGKTDEKRNAKDEMNRTLITKNYAVKFQKQKKMYKYETGINNCPETFNMRYNVLL